MLADIHDDALKQEASWRSGSAISADKPRPRWQFGSNHQLAYAFGLVVLAIASMIVLAFGILSPVLLGDQPHFSGSLAELAATAITLAYAAGYVWLFIVRIGRAPLSTLGYSRLENLRV